MISSFRHWSALAARAAGIAGDVLEQARAAAERTSIRLRQRRVAGIRDVVERPDRRRRIGGGVLDGPGRRPGHGRTSPRRRVAGDRRRDLGLVLPAAVP